MFKICYNIYMDIEAKARRQSRRVIISEVLMVLTVIATVSILAFIVSGYWVGSDFKIERQGLLQVYSTPTGATVEVDDSTSSWFQHTNTSKTLSAGEHTITLTKEGYDSWSRTINITEGLLYRLHYPRLFLKNRVEEGAFDSSANFATVSPDRNSMLLADNTTTWQLLNLDTDNIKPVSLDLSEILPYTSRADNAKVGLFSGTIELVNWASDNEHLILKISQDTSITWLLLNVKNPALSINLTKEFNTDFTAIKILDQSATNLLATIGGNLHRIDVPSKQISAILIPNVSSFDYFGQTVVVSAKKSDQVELKSPTAPTEPSSEDDLYYIGIFRLGSNEILSLKTTATPQKVVITKFYDDEYIGTIDETSITLYTKKDFAKKTTYNIPFNPEKIKVISSGEAIMMYTGGHIASLDMEANQLFDWSTDTDAFGWLDSSMIYAVKDGILNVYDFNGLNHRTLSSNVSAHFPITITSDKYLYYFRDGSLIREWLIEH